MITLTAIGAATAIELFVSGAFFGVTLWHSTKKDR